MNKILAFLASALLVCALAAMAGVPVAFAHAEIESCVPEIDSTVATAPDTILCTASQGMEAEGSTLSVWDANGVQVDKGDSAVDLNDPDRTKISVSLDTAKLADGVYTVKWTTVSADDGDEASGEFNFTVGTATEAQPTPTGEAHEEGGSHEEGETHEEGGTDSDDHSIASGTIDGKEVTLQIVAPAKDATVPAGIVTIEGKVEGITLGENDTHLHFYVDDELAGMGEGAQTSMDVTLEPGTHDIQVGLAMGEHEDTLKAHVHVTVEGAAQATQPTAEATATETTPPTTEAATPEATPPSNEPSTTEGTTLPATGAVVNYGAFTLVALGGLLLFALGAIVMSRSRR